MSKYLVRVFEQDYDHAFDIHLLPPDGMDAEEAVRLVDKAVIQVKTTYPAEYGFYDLMNILAPLGFSYPNLENASETW